MAKKEEITAEPNKDMIMAFAAVLKAEDKLRLLEVEKEKTLTGLAIKISDAEIFIIEAWKVVEEIMKKNGLLEDTLPGSANDYKIYYTTPRETVKVVDEKAVPKEFIKIEKSVMKKELLEHLKGLRDGKLNLPNWATIERGNSKLQWKAIKK